MPISETVKARLLELLEAVPDGETRPLLIKIQGEELMLRYLPMTVPPRHRYGDPKSLSYDPLTGKIIGTMPKEET